MVKEDGSLAGYDEPGELVIKSPTVALGYANNEEAYVGHERLRVLVSYPYHISVQRKLSLMGMTFLPHTVFCNSYFIRWVRTGDEVRIDRNGEIWVVDRLKVILSLIDKNSYD